MANLDWNNIQLVVFDIDGTLYDQRRLRLRMMAVLLGHYLTSPADARILRVISQFRKSREEIAVDELGDIEHLQYNRPAKTLQMEPAEVQSVIEKWMLVRPLRYLRRYRFPGVGRLIGELRDAGKTVSVLSDYPTMRKLEALELEVDLHVSALDTEVDRLKPHPRGLQRTLDIAGVGPEHALLVGDRDDRDGECARRLGVSCLIKTHRATEGGNSFVEFDTLLRALRLSSAAKATLQ